MNEPNKLFAIDLCRGRLSNLLEYDDEELWSVLQQLPDPVRHFLYDLKTPLPIPKSKKAITRGLADSTPAPTEKLFSGVTWKDVDLGNAAEVLPIVIDLGGESIKIGFSGHDLPSFFIPAVTGSLRKEFEDNSICMNSTGRSVAAYTIPGRPKNSYIGHDALSSRAILNLTWPLKDPLNVEWDSVEKLLSYAFYECLHVAPEEHPVIFVNQQPFQPKTFNEKLKQICFEMFNNPAYYNAIPPVMSLYSTGRTTGCVLDMGSSGYSIVPVYEGYAISTAVYRSRISEETVFDYFSKLFLEENSELVDVPPTVLANIKKQVCCFALDRQQLSLERKGTLSDGTTFIAKKCRLAPEIYHDPRLIESDEPSLVEAVRKVYDQVDIDCRKDVFQNFVVTGGPTLYQNFVKRFQSELLRAFPDARQFLADIIETYSPKENYLCRLPAEVVKNIISFLPRPNVCLLAYKEREISSWIGGSILSSMNSFQQMWISKEEYDECGPGVLACRKCF